MMKIALVTIHNANNYGAVFQAFALQEILKNYGEVQIINYDNRHVSVSFDLIRFKPTIHGILGMGKDICRIFPRKRVITKFKNFIAENLIQTKVYTEDELMNGAGSDFDLYVSGSDQIWNPTCISGDDYLNPIYLLGFTKQGARKFSYSSSMGAYKFEGDKKRQLAFYLSQFENLSIREKESASFVSKLLDRPVKHVLDPSVLLRPEDWLSKANISSENTIGFGEKYILLYTVPKVALISKAVEYFRKKLGYKIISIEQGLSAGAIVDRQIRDAGPKDFISLFAAAEFVITDSFHGVCFSTNFKKPFVAISPGKSVNRMISYLSLLGIEDRIIYNEAEFDELDLNPNMDLVEEKLNEVRQDCLEFISTSVNYGIKTE